MSDMQNDRENLKNKKIYLKSAGRSLVSGRLGAQQLWHQASLVANMNLRNWNQNEISNIFIISRKTAVWQLSCLWSGGGLAFQERPWSRWPVAPERRRHPPQEVSDGGGVGGGWIRRFAPIIRVCAAWWTARQPKKCRKKLQQNGLQVALFKTNQLPQKKQYTPKECFSMTKVPTTACWEANLKLFLAGTRLQIKIRNPSAR